MPLIQAWRDLHDPELGDDVARLVAVLDTVASSKPEHRWPLLESVSRWLGHPDPRVRRAALAATAGACGLPSWTAITDALSDGSKMVREAALRAFSATARDDPSRWILALYHQRADVRTAAFEACADNVHPWLWIRGLGDPALRDLIVPRLRDSPAPGPLLPLVLQHTSEGHLDRLDAAGIVASADWVRGTAPLVEALGGQPHPEPIPSAPDRLPDWLAAAPSAPILTQALDLLTEGVASGVPACVRTANELLTRALRDGLPDGIDTVATVLLERELLLARPLPRPLRLVVATRIPSMIGALTDPNHARDTLRGLSGYRRNGAHRTTLRELGVDHLVRSGPSGFDLRVTAGLVAITEKAALVELYEAVGPRVVAATATGDPVAAALLLAPPTRGSPGDGVRTKVLRAVIALDTDAAASLIARMALARPSLKLPRLDTAAIPALIGALAFLDDDARDGLLKTKAQQIIAKRWAESHLPHATLLRAVLLHMKAPGRVTLCLLGELVTTVGRASVLRLPRDLLKRLLALDDETPLVPWAVQQDLVVALTGHADPDLAAWAATHTPKPVTSPIMPASTGRRALTPKEAGRVKGLKDLNAAIAPALSSPVSGLVRALAGRTPTPHVGVCTALLMCHDPLDTVAEALVEWGFEDPGVGPLVEEKLLEVARNRTDIGPAAGALLFRWEATHDAFIEWFAKDPTQARQVLQASLDLPSATLRLALWKAARHMVGRWRWTKVGRLRSLANDDVVRAVVDTLKDRGGPGRPRGAYPHDIDDEHAVQIEAAGLLGRLATIRGMAAFRSEVEALRGDLPGPAQRALAKWLMTAGEVVAPPEPVADGREVELDPEAVIAGADGAALALLVAAPRRGVAELAVLRLCELKLWDALAQAMLDPAGPHPDLVSETVRLWTDDAALERIAAAATDLAHPAPVRFHAALGLAEREGSASPNVSSALAAAADPNAHFVRSADVTRLVQAADDAERVARELIVAPAFAAYTWAAHTLRTGWPPGAAEALRGFLLLGPSRARTVRIDVAKALRDHDDDTGIVLVVDEAMAQARKRKAAEAVAWARKWDPEAVAEISRAAMRAGERFVPGSIFIEGLFTNGVSRDAIEPSCAAILEQATQPAVQRRALDGLPTRLARTERAERLGHLFLWGRDQARRLLSRRFQIRYLVGDNLGMTRLEHSAIYVNPLPLLRGEKNGAAVVRGLMVHELGHHLYNADKEGLAIWTEANEAGLSRLHNLVCDEHLERNLRGIDPAYGDDLKKLGAWAFLHARRTIGAEELLARLGARAATVLIPTPLAPARTRSHVSLPLGRLFRALEADGSSFSRFFRAMRMGLGDRYDDPLVRQALELFGKDFRDLDNPGLWAVTQKLAALFEGELGILDVSDVHETAAGEEGDDPAEGRGVTNEDVQREVRRIEGTKDGINPKKPGGKARRGPRGPDTVNIGDDDSFNRIEHVQMLEHDPAAHAELARDVAREGRRLRDAFAQLGLQHRWVGPRVRGTRLDRARLLGASLRGDPRVLRARQRVPAADLHLSVVVDCSGSMTGERMDRARRMATLLAEACRPLDGVDLRLFGFTDSTIYDAGDDQRCAAHALEAMGGNNDAAGLYHAAQAALQSPRTARLVVMISDGLPTECTTAALTALVRRLRQRHQLPCAQIAVAPISEHCFDTYLEVLDDDIGAAVRRFGALVTGLVANTLRG